MNQADQNTFCYNYYQTLLTIILCLPYYYLGEPQGDVQVRVQALQLLGDEGCQV